MKKERRITNSAEENQPSFTMLAAIIAMRDKSYDRTKQLSLLAVTFLQTLTIPLWPKLLNYIPNELPSEEYYAEMEKNGTPLFIDDFYSSVVIVMVAAVAPIVVTSFLMLFLKSKNIRNSFEKLTIHDAKNEINKLKKEIIKLNNFIFYGTIAFILLASAYWTVTVSSVKEEFHQVVKNYLLLQKANYQDSLRIQDIFDKIISQFSLIAISPSILALIKKKHHIFKTMVIENGADLFDQVSNYTALYHFTITNAQEIVSNFQSEFNDIDFLLKKVRSRTSSSLLENTPIFQKTSSIMYTTNWACYAYFSTCTMLGLYIIWREWNYYRDVQKQKLQVSHANKEITRFITHFLPNLSYTSRENGNNHDVIGILSCASSDVKLTQTSDRKESKLLEATVPEKEVIALLKLLPLRIIYETTRHLAFNISKFNKTNFVQAYSWFPSSLNALIAIFQDRNKQLKIVEQLTKKIFVYDWETTIRYTHYQPTIHFSLNLNGTVASLRSIFFRELATIFPAPARIHYAEKTAILTLSHIPAATLINMSSIHASRIILQTAYLQHTPYDSIDSISLVEQECKKTKIKTKSEHPRLEYEEDTSRSHQCSIDYEGDTFHYPAQKGDKFSLHLMRLPGMNAYGLFSLGIQREYKNELDYHIKALQTKPHEHGALKPCRSENISDKDGRPCHYKTRPELAASRNERTQLLARERIGFSAIAPTIFVGNTVITKTSDLKKGGKNYSIRHL